MAATRAGERKTKAPAANGRRAAAVSPGRRATTRGDGVYTGMARENERERANGLDSPEGARRRRIAAAATGGEGRGNGDEVTRGRFPVVRASTRPRESIPCAGLGRATPSEAGDERRYRARADGGKHIASGGSSRGGAS
ncbi:Epstein-Barr virus EBNA-1-like protein [Oryza sativa Japonica Group]|uniref:Epstein-Barr virus EBNA-1-like protein n=1 Tax=Oryza sativa subsp. japonica TaxID=39947 RepID=Q5JLS0_ORYSJ|nr:Epstein-Barr virus EBNA-1-like protein [Oryza sativa Japonica Group]